MARSGVATQRTGAESGVAVTALLIVEPEGGNLWRVTEPNGAQHSGVTCVEAEAMAHKWRATAATPEQAADYQERQRLALEYAEEFRKTHPYVGPDEVFDARREGVLTPSLLRHYLASRGVGDCVIELQDGVLYIDVPFGRFHQFGISVRKVVG